MNEHLRDDRLNDYVDDLLCREERAEVERHLIGCAECSTEVARLRNLLADLGALPGGIVPERDLLAGIRERTSDAVPEPVRAPASGWRRRSAAAAAVLALGTAATIGYVLGTQDRSTSISGERGAAPAPAVRTVAAVDAQYAHAAAELERMLEQNRAVLRPQTVRIIEENLAVIDAALEEARAALRDDPGNPMIEQMLRANHEQKLDLLRRAMQAGA